MKDDWIESDKELPNVFAGKFRVKMKNGMETDSFFYADAMAWICFYGQKTSYWWDAQGTHERLDDVIAWKPLIDTKNKKCN